MLESEIQRDIITYLELIKCKVFRMNSGIVKSAGGGRMHLCEKGTPDLLVIGKNLIMWIEVKRADEKLSESQKKMFDYLFNCGQCVVVCSSVEDVQKAIKNYTGISAVVNTFGYTNNL